MCGIVGAVADRDATPILLEGLQRLEYRGYDSAGVVVLEQGGGFQRRRVRGKVNELAQSVSQSSLRGNTGIAHTRWATHGRPSVDNAHPHICKDGVALVHNGIIENHEALRAQQREAGYEFASETDTEVVVNQIHRHLGEGGDLLAAVQATAREIEGTYALGVLDSACPERLVAARKGSPLVIGIGDNGRFIASDIFALLPVAQRFMVLEEGDVADLGRKRVAVFDAAGRPVDRLVIASNMPADGADKSGYRHYMLKEIFTQPPALADTLEGRVENCQLWKPGWPRRSLRLSNRPAMFTSSPAAAATTPGWWPSTGWRPWPGSSAASTSPANTATATRWCRTPPCLWLFPSLARPWMSWRPCA